MPKLCYLLNMERNQFFTTCEALILHRLDQQAERNRDVQKADIDSKLQKSKEALNKMYEKSKETLENVD